ncbi:tetratricopeptide repeat protein [bacterium]|nr:tetratricopeptide repeat protein [bacterium]
MKKTLAVAAMLLLANIALAAPDSSAGVFIMASDQVTTTTVSATESRGLALLEEEDRPVSARLDEMRALVKSEQLNATLMTAYGELLSKSGDDEAATIAFEQAIALDGKLYTPWLWLGILAKRGTPKPDLAKAESSLRRALELGAPKARTLNELAVAVAMAGRMREARDLWLEAVPDDPQWGVLYGNLVKACLALGDEKTAFAQLEPALKAERFNEAVVLQLGTHLERGKRWEEAESLYRQALEKHPMNVSYNLALGRTLVEQKKPDAAIECFQTAKRLGRRQGNATSAQQAEWEIFRIENPKDEATFQSVRELVFAQSADRRQLERDYKKAISRLSPLIERHPTFWNARFVRGVAYRRLDEREKAKIDLEAVLEIYPEEPNATMELALMTRDNLDFAGAAKLAERAVELAPRDPIFAVNAGFIMIEAGNCDRAWDLYRQSLRMVGEENTAPLLDQLNLRCPAKE